MCSQCRTIRGDGCACSQEHRQERGNLATFILFVFYTFLTGIIAASHPFFTQHLSSFHFLLLLCASLWTFPPRPTRCSFVLNPHSTKIPTCFPHFYASFFFLLLLAMVHLKFNTESYMFLHLVISLHQDPCNSHAFFFFFIFHVNSTLVDGTLYVFCLQLTNLDPFLMLDEFKVSKPAGFPDHPHRGFETVSV